MWSACPRLPTFRVGGRDQAKLRVEDVDQVVEVSGSVRVSRCFEQFLARSHLSLDVGAALGQRAFSTAWAAFWWRRCSGLAVRALKVSSRNVTPTPSVPPISSQRRRRPDLSLDHLGKQSQPDRDDLAVLGQSRNGLIQKVRSVPGRSLGVFGQVSRRLGRIPSAPSWRGEDRKDRRRAMFSPRRGRSPGPP